MADQLRGPMMNKFVLWFQQSLLLLWFISMQPAQADCIEEPALYFGLFSTKKSAPDYRAKHFYGDSVTKKDNTVVIDKTFIKKLMDENSETADVYENNREELFYLISRGDQEALNAGLHFLAYRLKQVKYRKECGVKFDVLKLNELAFVLSRNIKVDQTLCELAPTLKQRVISYYKKHPSLWAVQTDVPWSDDFCKLKRE